MYRNRYIQGIKSVQSSKPTNNASSSSKDDGRTEEELVDGVRVTNPKDDVVVGQPYRDLARKKEVLSEDVIISAINLEEVVVLDKRTGLASSANQYAMLEEPLRKGMRHGN